MNIYRSKQKPSPFRMKTYLLRGALYGMLSFNVYAISLSVIYFMGVLPLFAAFFTSLFSLITMLLSFNSSGGLANRIVYKIVIDEEKEDISFHYFKVFPCVERISFSEFHYDCLIYPKAKMGGQIIISKNNNAAFSSIFRFVVQHRDMWDECTWDVQDLIDLSVHFEKISLKYETWEPYAFKKLPRLQRDEKIIWSKRWSEEDYQRIRIIGTQF